MRAWVFQDSRQRKRLGDKCPWSVGWLDPDGKRRSKKIGSKSMATKMARKIEGQLVAGLYEGECRKTWPDFRREYEAKILPLQAVATQRVTQSALDSFERIVRPVKLSAITTRSFDEFVTVRQTDRGKKPGSKVAPATVNRELRTIRAALQVAMDWGYVLSVPKIRKMKETAEIGRVINAEHFEVIYEHCDVATKPGGYPFSPGDWWRALLLFALTTGWRIEEILAFRRDDLNLETGAILTRAKDNKGSRDDADYLTDVAREHIQRLRCFEPCVFPWPHHERTLWAEFQKIQRQAGIYLPCPDAGEHQCNDACHTYGFHAFRRGYATLNAERMPAPVLQKKMRHKSFTTTLRYIGLADKLRKATDDVYVPEFLQKRKAN